MSKRPELDQQAAELAPAQLGDALANWPGHLSVAAIVAVISLGLMSQSYWNAHSDGLYQLEAIGLMTVALLLFWQLFLRASGLGRYRLALAWALVSIPGLLKFTADYLFLDNTNGVRNEGLFPFAAFYPVAVCFHYAFLNLLHARWLSAMLLVIAYALFIADALLVGSGQSLGKGWFYSFCSAIVVGVIAILLMELHMRIQGESRSRMQQQLRSAQSAARLRDAIESVDPGGCGANVHPMRKAVVSALEAGSVVHLGSVRIQPPMAGPSFIAVVAQSSADIGVWFQPGHWGLLSGGGLLFWAEDCSSVEFLARIRRVTVLLQENLPLSVEAQFNYRHQQLKRPSPIPADEQFRSFIDVEIDHVADSGPA